MPRATARSPARSPARAARPPTSPARGAPGTPRVPVVAVGSILAALIFVVAFARLWSYVLDDTYISLRYAQHLAQGQGLVYNPGERVEGFSNFLWTVFLVLPFLLHIAPVPFLKIAIALMTLATAWATARLARASGLAPPDPDRRWLAWVPGWLFLVTPLVVERAADGLETIPFTLLLVMGTTWAFEEKNAPRFPRLALALAGLAMMRPDGILSAPVLIGIAALRGASVRRLAFTSACFVVLLALFLLGRHAYYGDWLPNTYFAKRGGGMLWGVGWATVLPFFAQHGGWAWLVALPALVARPTRAAAWGLLAVAITRFVFHAWAGGELVGFRRFLVPTFPFLYLLVIASLPLIRQRTLVPAAAFAVVAWLVSPAWVAHPLHEAELLAYARGLDQAQGAFGRAVAARTAPDALIAMDDAGLGPYLARRRNLDMLGLCDKHIARLPGRFLKYDKAYVLARAPDLIVLVSKVAEPERGDQFTIPGHAALASDSTFHARYDLQRVYPMRRDYYLGVFRRKDTKTVPADF